ncbi:TonB-dependent receptor [Paracoccus sp. DMF-8]|uniref:TonB-dependent receptor domain-containing protein n=1 Tax=Paracoccus sp. DMF-8 TaxID=3019445 RepID=UPI0023E7F52F|nr:TonB-dependent receptor [Paracoccus sp. DMF-8]MDF3607129.1 TonB-dependent receptor [Paracoccus sp. DMF-8]
MKPSARKATGILIGALALGPAGAALLAAQDQAEGVVILDRVIVSVSAGDEEGLNAASTMDAQELALRYPGADLPQILTDIPGVSTQATGDGPGVAVNIRGLQDFGRVNVLVDGARQNFQKSGHGANGTFYTDTEMLKSVQVMRGPGAMVNGSGAIGGVVNMVTLDPADIIADGADRGGRLRCTLDNNGPGPTVNLIGAMRMGDRAEFLAGGTILDLRDYTAGDGSKVASGQEMRSGLVKGVFRPAEGHEISLSASRYLNSFVAGTGTMRDTDATVDTVTAGYRWTSPDSDFWDVTLRGYWTSTQLDQMRPASDQLEQSFRVQTFGIDAHNTARFQTGELDHELTFGIDAYRDRVRTIDDLGTSQDLTPPGRRLAWGAFVEDRVTVSPWLQVIGGLRYDSYSLENSRHSVDGDRFSPKLTIGLTPNDTTTFHLSYAQGFRAPSLTETLIEGFHPGSVSGEFLPNPDLRPEIARTIEAGVTLRHGDLLAPGDFLTTRLTVFQNDVSDYIDQDLVLHGLYGAYQYLNIAKVRIRGVEIEANYDPDRFFASLNGQYLDGERRSNEDLEGILFYPSDNALQPKIPPWRMVLTAGLRAPDERWRAGARLTLVGARGEDSSTAAFSSEAHETLDLFGQYRIREGLDASIALNNIFDKNLTQYLNTSPSPGFNARAVLTMSF